MDCGGDREEMNELEKIMEILNAGISKKVKRILLRELGVPESAVRDLVDLHESGDL